MDILGDERGAVMVEYALVLALLSCVMISGMKAIDVSTSVALNNVETSLLNYGLVVSS